MNDDFNLLEEMIHSCGVSGYNEESYSIFLREASKLGLTCAPDILGSASAFIAPPNIYQRYRPKNIMVCSHHDTHGHIVSKLNKDKTIDLKTVAEECCENEEGIVRTKSGIVPIIFFDVDEENLTAKARLQDNTDYTKISIGDIASLKPWVEEKIKGKLSGTFLDNKIGCLITVLVMRNLVKSISTDINSNIYIVHTSFEETSISWGAKAAVEKIKPSLVINVDMGPVDKKSQLGKGPLIYTGPRFNRKLNNLAINICEELKIPYEIEICSDEASSDVDVIPPLNGGTAVCEIAYPGMNFHEFEEHVSKRDIYRTSKLVTEMCLRAQYVDSLLPGGLNELSRMQ